MASPVVALLLEEGGDYHQLITRPKSHPTPTDISSLTYTQLLASLKITNPHKFVIYKIVHAETMPYAHVILHQPGIGLAPKPSRDGLGMKDLSSICVIVRIHIDSNAALIGVPRTFFPIADINALMHALPNAAEAIKVNRDIQNTELGDDDDAAAAFIGAAALAEEAAGATMNTGDTPNPWISTQLAHVSRKYGQDAMDTDARIESTALKTLYIVRATAPQAFVKRKLPTDDPAFLRWLATVLNTTFTNHIYHAAGEDPTQSQYHVYYATDRLNRLGDKLTTNRLATMRLKPPRPYKGTVVIIRKVRNPSGKWQFTTMTRAPTELTLAYQTEGVTNDFDYETTGNPPPDRIDPDTANDAAVDTDSDDTILVSMLTQFGTASIPKKRTAAIGWDGASIPTSNTFSMNVGSSTFERTHLPLAEGKLPAGISTRKTLNEQGDFARKINIITTNTKADDTHYLKILPKKESNSVVYQWYAGTFKQQMDFLFGKNENGEQNTYTVDLCVDTVYPTNFQYLVVAASPRLSADKNYTVAAYYGLTEEAGFDNMYGTVAIHRILIGSSALPNPIYQYIGDLRAHARTGTLYPLVPLSFSPRRRLVPRYQAISLPTEQYPLADGTPRLLRDTDTPSDNAADAEEEETENDDDDEVLATAADIVAADVAADVEIIPTTSEYRRETELPADVIEDETVYYLEPGSKKEKARPAAVADQVPYNQAELEENIAQIPATIEEHAEYVPFDSCNANRTIIPDTIGLIENQHLEEEDLAHMPAPALVNCYISRAGLGNERGFIKRRFPLYESNPGKNTGISRDFSAAFTSWCTCLLRSQNHEYHLLTHVNVPPGAETDPSMQVDPDQVTDLEQGVQYLAIIATEHSIEVTQEPTEDNPDPETAYKISRPPVNNFFSAWAQISPPCDPTRWIPIKGNAIIIRIYSTTIFGSQFVPYNNDDLTGEALNTYIMAQSSDLPLASTFFPLADEFFDLKLDSYGKKPRKGTDELNEREHDTSVEQNDLYTPSQIRTALLKFWGANIHAEIEKTRDPAYHEALKKARADLQDEIRAENARNERLAMETKNPWIRKFIPCDIDGVPIDPDRDLIDPNPIKIINPETGLVDTSLITDEIMATIEAGRSCKAPGIGTIITQTNMGHPRETKKSRRITPTTTKPRLQKPTLSAEIILDDEEEEEDLPHKSAAQKTYDDFKRHHPFLVDTRAKMDLTETPRQSVFREKAAKKPRPNAAPDDDEAVAAPATRMETEEETDDLI